MVGRKGSKKIGIYCLCQIEGKEEKQLFWKKKEKFRHSIYFIKHLLFAGSKLCYFMFFFYPFRIVTFEMNEFKVSMSDK